MAILVAKVFFMGTGYLLVGGLSRALGPEGFGTYSVLFSVIAVANMVAIQGGLQAMSHFVARHPDKPDAVRLDVLRYHAWVIGPVVALLFLGAPGFARFLGANQLEPLLRLASSITLLYAMYALNVGFLNGCLRFVEQAKLDIGFAALKTITILALAFAGLGVVGVVGAFAGSAAVILVASFLLTGWPRRSSQAPVVERGTYVRYATSVMGVSFLFNLLLQVDLLGLAWSLGEAGSQSTGYYGAAQQIARIPYYLSTSVGLVLFPRVAKLSALSPDARANLVSRALTSFGGILVGMGAATIPIAARVIRVLFPPSYEAAAGPLPYLIAGTLLLTMTFLLVTTVSASGAANRSAGILALAVTVQVAIVAIACPQLGVLGAAFSTLGAGLAGVFVGGRWAYRELGLRVRREVWLASVLAGTLTVGLVGLLDASLPTDAPFTVGIVALGFLFHLTVLLLAGTLTGIPASRRQVLLVSKPLGPPWNDGAKTVALSLARELSADTIGILIEKGTSLEGFEGAEHVSVRGVRLGGPRGLANLRLFASILLVRRRFAVLHFMFAPNKMACWAVRILRVLTPGVAFVQTIMSPPRSADTRGMRFGDRVFAHSHASAARFYGPVDVLRPPCSIPLSVPARAEALSTLGWPVDRNHLLFAGDIEHGSAAALLQQILPPLLDTLPSLMVHLSIRSKTEASGPMLQALRQGPLAPWKDRVRTYIDSERFAELLDGMDAMILPTETLVGKVDAPMVALEAHARGKPVFGLDRSPMNEMYPPDKQRWLGENPDALVQLVRAWLAAPRTEPSLAEHVRTEHSPKEYAKVLRAAYREVSA